MNNLSASAKKVQEAIHASGFDLQVVELPASTRTAQEAADAVGCDVGQIIKSIIFRAKRSGVPILVIASGKNRVHEPAIEAMIGEPLGKADADFVRAQTGFVIGGVPPVGHDNPLTTFIDQDLLGYPYVWAAAGTPHAVFKLNPADLHSLTGGTLIKITT